MKDGSEISLTDKEKTKYGIREYKDGKLISQNGQKISKKNFLFGNAEIEDII